MPGESFLSILVFSFLLAIGAVMSPGPVSTTIISQAPRSGWRIGPLITIGHAILELLMVLALAFGLQSILALPAVEILIALLGGALLIWMGFSMLLRLRQGRFSITSAAEEEQKETMRRVVWLGILATVANPFWFGWWVSVPPSYLSQVGELGFLALMAFFIGHISADFAWNSFLAAAVGGGRKWINDRVYKIILGACAFFFVYLGFTFLGAGISLVQGLIA